MLRAMDADSKAGLPRAARQWLLAWARRCIAAYLSDRPAPAADDRPPEVNAPRACFVTLHERGGELRGCIGTFDDSVPLWENVMAMALAASTRDPRFSPMRAAELPGCVLEISALTPRVPITPEAVVVGEHGLWVVRGGRQGVLLPQVPVGYGWDRETFLEHTCLKAGLPRDAWRDPDTRLEAFTAEVFGEGDLGEEPARAAV